MRLDFTWINWAGEKCILVTDRNDDGKPIIIFREYEIRILKKLLEERQEKK
jgi:hypothetical protein